MSPRLAFLALGASALLGQVLLVREMLVVFSGNEMVLGVVLGIWLAAIAIGAGLGSFVAARTRRPRAWLAGALIGMGPLLLAQMTAVRFLFGLLGAEPGSLLSLGRLLTVSPVLVAPLPVLVGLAFAPACRVAREAAPGDVSAATLVYVLEAAGALAAGLAHTFAFAGHVSATSIAALAGALAAGGTVVVLRGRGRTVAAAFSVLLVVGAIPPVGDALDRIGIERRWADRAPGRRLVVSRETRYGVVEIGEREGQFDLYLSGSYATSFPDPWSAGPPAHLALCAHPSPRRVLVIGGGVDGILQAMATHRCVERIEHAETDPDIARAVREQLPEDLRRELDDPRIALLAVDGRRAVLREAGARDVVFVNAPEPSSTLLNRLYTVEFFEEARRALRPDGVLVLRLETPDAYEAGEDVDLVATIWRSLGVAFPHRRVVVAGSGCYLLASGSAETLVTDGAALGWRYLRQGAVDPEFSPIDPPDEHAFEGGLVPERTRTFGPVLDARSGPLNRDGHPTAVLPALIQHEEYAGGEAVSLLRGLVTASPRAPALVGIVLVFTLALLVAALRRRPSGRGLATASAVAAAGFAAMTLEMTLLLRLQTAHGHVYGRVGAVVAVFMAGLALGGWWGAGVFARDVRRSGLRLGLILVGMLALTLLAPRILDAVSSLDEAAGLAAFLGVATVAGLLTGLVFPGAIAFRLAPGGADGAAVAGGLDAADHLGAALGALVTGVILLPLVGQEGACGVAALLVGGSLVALALPRP